jgi:hypothetical protein
MTRNDEILLRSIQRLATAAEAIAESLKELAELATAAVDDDEDQADGG